MTSAVYTQSKRSCQYLVLVVSKHRKTAVFGLRRFEIGAYLDNYVAGESRNNKGSSMRRPCVSAFGSIPVVFRDKLFIPETGSFSMKMSHSEAIDFV